MTQVLKAFRSLLTGADKEISAAEFSSFWKDCSDELKETLKANAAAMGFAA